VSQFVLANDLLDSSQNSLYFISLYVLLIQIFPVLIVSNLLVKLFHSVIE
jgi:hypothetical protein